MTLSCLQTQYHYQGPAASPKDVLVCLWSTASVCWLSGNTRRFHLNDAGLFSITANFLAPADQHQLIVPIKQRFHFSGAGLLEVTIDSSAPLSRTTNSEYVMALIAFKQLSNFLLKLQAKPGLHCLHFSSTFIPSELPQSSEHSMDLLTQSYKVVP